VQEDAAVSRALPQRVQRVLQPGEQLAPAEQAERWEKRVLQAQPD
jgi:hypothetical protein